MKNFSVTITPILQRCDHRKDLVIVLRDDRADVRGLPVAQEHLTAIDAQALDGRERAIDHGLVRQLLAHEPALTFPPTTTLGMRSVGWASATGAPWPSLPHVPTE